MIHFLDETAKSAIRGTVLLRLDFNSGDSWRREAIVPTVKFLLKHSDKVVIVSHRGRPESVKFSKGVPSGFDGELSMRRDAAGLTKILGRKVNFVPHFRFDEIRRTVAKAPRGSIFLLENIRFMKGERESDPRLAKTLASLADFYVNDSFAVNHRSEASLVPITKLLPSYGGLCLKKEMEVLGRVMKNPKRPLAIILGGAKAKDKLGVMKFFHNKADAFLIGGAAANTLLHLKGIPVGASLIEKNPDDLQKIKTALGYKNLVLPPDWRDEKTRILDIGKKAEKLFAAKIGKARTIIWSGPMGFTEKKGFASGTLAVARAIAANKRALSVVGGGETVMFLKKYKLDKKFGFVSTGGGAMLVFLAGEKMPAIEALKTAKKA